MKYILKNVIQPNALRNFSEKLYELYVFLCNYLKLKVRSENIFTTLSCTVVKLIKETFIDISSNRLKNSVRHLRRLKTK